MGRGQYGGGVRGARAVLDASAVPLCRRRWCGVHLGEGLEPRRGVQVLGRDVLSPGVASLTVCCKPQGSQLRSRLLPVPEALRAL